jgi:hypothetical protein
MSPSPLNEDTPMLEGESIMSSIAAVKEILAMGVPADQKTWEDELNASKQQRYEDTRKLQEQLLEQQDQVRRLKSDLEEATNEAKRERAFRVTLETTNDAMEEHKKELNSQLELVNKCKQIVEDEMKALRSKQETAMDAFLDDKEELKDKLEGSNQQHLEALKKAGECEAKFLASERETGELRKKLVEIRNQAPLLRPEVDLARDILVSKLAGKDIEELKKQVDQGKQAQEKTQSQVSSFMRSVFYISLFQGLR